MKEKTAENKWAGIAAYSFLTLWPVVTGLLVSLLWCGWGLISRIFLTGFLMVSALFLYAFFSTGAAVWKKKQDAKLRGETHEPAN